MDSFITSVISEIIQPAIGFLFVVAIAFMGWGIIEYFLYEDSDDARETGRQHMLWGFFGFLIMVGAYTIISIIAGTFGVSIPSQQISI
mgnify:CR=1 FL=1